MTNFNTNKKKIVENTEIEKVEEYRYLGQNIEMKDKTLKEVQKKESEQDGQHLGNTNSYSQTKKCQ